MTSLKATIGPRGRMTVGLVLALAVGAAGGTAATRFVDHHRPQSVLMLQPTPIGKLAAGPAAVTGQVAEVFGTRFVVQDPTGRTLVDLGPRGDGTRPMTAGETVTVQGRFDNGALHAAVMTRADGTSEAFGPPGPPPHHAPPRPGHGEPPAP